VISSRAVALVGAVIVTVVLQLTLLRWRGNSPPAKRPVIGERLPDLTVESLYGNYSSPLILAATEFADCAVVVVVATHCKVCQRMRVTWPSRFLNLRVSTKSNIAALWISAQPKDSLRSFLSDLAFGELRAGMVKSNDALALHRLGVVGTPTSYLIDRNGTLRAGLLGDQLPPADSVVAACAAPGDE
jgi:hypothetical protein